MPDRKIDSHFVQAVFFTFWSSSSVNSVCSLQKHRFFRHNLLWTAFRIKLYAMLYAKSPICSLPNKHCVFLVLIHWPLTFCRCTCSLHATATCWMWRFRVTAASESHRGIATAACSAPTWTCARPASSVSHTFAAGDDLHCNEGQQHCHEALFPFIYYSNIKLDTMQLIYYSSIFHTLDQSECVYWMVLFFLFRWC